MTTKEGHQQLGEATLRMRDLCEASGMTRQAIHFYVRKGLLPPGQKTGRNAALYTEAHVERLALIRQLKEERFLPLKAIKALLEGGTGSYSVEQTQFLSQVRARLGATFRQTDEDDEFVPIEEVLAATRIDEADIHDAIDDGMISGAADGSGIARRDLWMVELFAEMRRLGFTRELGFTISDVNMYEEAISGLLSSEAKLITGRLSGHDPAEVAEMIERALPVIHAFLARYHLSQVREFFGAQTRRAKAADANEQAAQS